MADVVITTVLTLGILMVLALAHELGHFFVKEPGWPRAEVMQVFAAPDIPVMILVSFHVTFI